MSKGQGRQTVPHIRRQEGIAPGRKRADSRRQDHIHALERQIPQTDQELSEG